MRVANMTERESGRILSMRLGINPNSSGHGILWGALFFLPTGLLALLLSAWVQSRLDRALEEYRHGQDHE